MGLYSTLVADVRCTNCKQKHKRELQFNFGNVRLLTYQIGDQIQWGGNDEGKPNLSKVQAQAHPDECPNCGFNDDYFEILIEKDVIKDVHWLEDLSSYIKINEYFIIIEE